MSGVMNWPPSRGPNPHEHRTIYTPGAVSRKDLPCERSTSTATIEKLLIAKAETGKLKVAKLKASKTIGPFTLKRRRGPKPPLAGSWSVWYQVEDVAALTLEQAVKLLKANRVGPKPDKNHNFDEWWDYEPRTLHVDITYPLATGVRLVVPPMK